MLQLFFIAEFHNTSNPFARIQKRGELPLVYNAPASSIQVADQLTGPLLEHLEGILIESDKCFLGLVGWVLESAITANEAGVVASGSDKLTAAVMGAADCEVFNEWHFVENKNDP